MCVNKSKRLQLMMSIVVRFMSCVMFMYYVCVIDRNRQLSTTNYLISPLPEELILFFLTFLKRRIAIASSIESPFSNKKIRPFQYKKVV